jgi:hypothetical protein
MVEVYKPGESGVQSTASSIFRDSPDYGLGLASAACSCPIVWCSEQNKTFRKLNFSLLNAITTLATKLSRCSHYFYYLMHNMFRSQSYRFILSYLTTVCFVLLFLSRLLPRRFLPIIHILWLLLFMHFNSSGTVWICMLVIIQMKYFNVARWIHRVYLGVL